MELPAATVIYDYDDFYRVSYDVEINGSDILTTDYTFVDGVAENSTTILVESMTNAGNGWSDTLSYTYDCKGNIETIFEDGEQKAKYYYDELNQLIREDNSWTNKTVVYNYDNGGNILSVDKYTLTSASDISFLVASSTDVYAYTDSNWKDKLTSFNGNAITYDEIGNPLNYYNGFTFDWQNGRQLAGISASDLSISYKYNSSGIRTQKTVNGVTTYYTLEGSNVVKESNGTDTIWYYYDASGSLTGFELNGTPYFYVSNIQGDIVAITDSSGNIVVEYAYDSWGKLVTVSGTLADTVGIKNPFRYRGYYYDTETGLYYLNSRYYDPAIKRFINADGYVSTGQGLLGNNMFAYCTNNVSNRTDSDGELWEYIIIPVIILIATALSGCSVYDNLNCYAYALKLEKDPRTGNDFTARLQPGELSNNPLKKNELASCGPDTAKAILEEKFKSDASVLGLYAVEVYSAECVPSNDGWLIAVAYDISGGGFHYWRKEDDGTWSHKLPGENPRYKDWSENVIYDPQKSDRGRYSIFLGYYEIGIA